jgi:predicted DNA-binding protein (MmcQ/YjbR family)
VEQNNRIFAIADLAHEPLDVSVKCVPDRAEALRADYRSIVPGYHLNRQHWITIVLNEDASDELVQSLLTDSYDLVRPKSKRARAET